jgi:hypothetical protein
LKDRQSEEINAPDDEDHVPALHVLQEAAAVPDQKPGSHDLHSDDKVAPIEEE